MGPIYQGGVKQTIGGNKVAVPTHLYKIIYDPKKREAIAFIIPNEPLYTKDLPRYIVSIREAEERTGLDFLSNLELSLQNRVERKKAQAPWK
jgi:endonuclease G